MRKQLQKNCSNHNKEEDNEPDWRKVYDQFGGLHIYPTIGNIGNIGNMKKLLPTSNETSSDPKSEIVKQEEKPKLDSKSKKIYN